MLKVLSIVGRSDSGKTTVLEGLIRELKKRGRRVGVLKHAHGELRMDHEGTDTHRLKLAGADTVAIAGPAGCAVISTPDDEPPARELAIKLFSDCDFIFTEGYKKGPFPKIEVLPRGGDAEPLCKVLEDRLVAVVGNGKVGEDVEKFGTDDAQALADFVENRYINDPAKTITEIIVNGKRVRIKDFVQDMIRESILGQLGTLRGVDADDINDVYITIRMGK
jgi:molybdopterin-guanine dinucleotide biosynthesis protein B